MADKTQTVQATEPQVEKKSRIKNFIATHPRTSKVIGVLAIVTVVAAVVVVVKNDDDSDSTQFDAQADEQSSPETILVTEA